MSERVVYFNGEFVKESEAKVSIYDSALMFGDMVFEMTRSFNKAQFKLRDHIERLYRSIKYVHIDIDMSMDEMENAVDETITINDPSFEDDDEHRILINVSRGILSIYDKIPGLRSGTNIIISDFPLKWTVSSMGCLYDEGINAVVTSQRSIPSSLLDPKIKSRSRLHYVMANIEASKVSGERNWALLLDVNGFVSEGTGDNFFIVKDNVIITPKKHNILRGISRSYVLDISSKMGIECVEGDIDLYDVMDSDEAFMTGTPFCILPVSSINNRTISTNIPGKVTQSLLDVWSSNVGVDIIDQIKKWSKETKPSVTPYQFK